MWFDVITPFKVGSQFNESECTVDVFSLIKRKLRHNMTAVVHVHVYVYIIICTCEVGGVQEINAAASISSYY